MAETPTAYDLHDAKRVARATRLVEAEYRLSERADYGTPVKKLGGGISGLVTGNASGKGKYTGKSFQDVTADVAASGDLAEADFGTLAASDDCLILNPVELGSSTTGHDVTAADNTAKFAIYFTGRLARINSDGTKVVHAQMFYVGCS